MKVCTVFAFAGNSRCLELMNSCDIVMVRGDVAKARSALSTKVVEIDRFTSMYADDIAKLLKVDRNELEIVDVGDLIDAKEGR